MNRWTSAMVTPTSWKRTCYNYHTTMMMTLYPPSLKR